MSVVACWSESPSAERFTLQPRAGPAGWDAMCEEVAAARCAWFERCDPVQWVGHNKDGQCLPRVWRLCVEEYSRQIASLLAGRMRFDRAVAVGCIDGTAQRDCTMPPPPACGLMFRGGVARDDLCATDAECDDGSYCSGSCGRCTPRSRAGERCGVENDCERGLTCIGSLCAPYTAIGERCSAATSCVAGAACFGTTDRRCAPLPLVGERCGSSCADGATCASVDGERRCMGPAGEGEPCVAGTCNQPALHCGRSGVCERFTVASAGEPCEWPCECAIGTERIAQRCVALPAAGDPCVFGCFNATCFREGDGGRCHSQGLPGDSCEYGCGGLSCQLGFCGAIACRESDAP